MKKKLIYTYCFLVFISIATVSCNKFLTDTPQSTLTTGNAYNTAADIENNLVGCYNILYTDYYQWQNVLMSDMIAGDSYLGGGGDAGFVNLRTFNEDPSNGNMEMTWSQLYQGIARCNLLLNNITAVTDPSLTSTRRAQIIGEASFLRALHYFNLVKTWGGVPIELLSNSVDPTVTRKPRSTELEVYTQIVTDLQTAVTNLPDTYSTTAITTTRATKGAANALLAKVWAQRSDRDYNKVLTYCNAVINSPAGYSLVPNYANLFDGSNYFNSEAIFLNNFIAGGPDANWGVELFLAPEDGWQKYCVPSHDLVNAYTAAGDNIRENATIVFWNVDGNGNPIAWPDQNWNPCQDPTVSIPFNYKQKHPNGWSSGDDYYILRLADIILLRAEAENALGQTAAAATDVNTVRARVQLAPIASNLSQSAMLTTILNERRLELAFEAQRWDDLRRTGQAIPFIKGLKEYTYTCNNGVPSAPTLMNFPVDQNHLLLPIPLQEIQNDPSLTQNPGY
ncbi:MAG: RagB/SusD family nutrient uptake outer membrane protein [Bacteroidota bacterium]|nr:RagB/SusD family nutrient uptake outer membrane protein [Bacteroidota bacterium]